ncbi:MAG: hypothetical protein KC466_13765, partial [Myxococcales bacterium]|nr:hypothetical protein [Myxococcales bacterium]
MSLVASILFALLSLVGAAITYNLYRPLRYRGGLLLGLSFFGGWLGSELALHHLVVQVVVTVVFGLLGAFKHPPGQAGLALTAISWGATLVAYRRGMRTDRAVEAALVEGLGADYRARIRPEAADR